MCGEPVVGKDAVRQLGTLLLVGDYFYLVFLDVVSKAPEFFFGLLARLELVKLDFVHEFVVFEGFLIEEEVRRLYHKHAGGEVVATLEEVF